MGAREAPLRRPGGGPQGPRRRVSPGPHFTASELAAATGGRWIGGAARRRRGRLHRHPGHRRRAAPSWRCAASASTGTTSSPRRRGRAPPARWWPADRAACGARRARRSSRSTTRSRALGAIARLHRRRFPIPVVGVTGSNGKTTTREMIAAILATRGPVLKTEGNLNNEVGVPLTLLRLAPEHTRGGDRDGDEPPRARSRRLTAIAEPRVGVVTNAFAGPPGGARHASTAWPTPRASSTGAPRRRRGGRQRRRPAHAAQGPQVGAPRPHLRRRAAPRRRRGGARRPRRRTRRAALPARHRHQGGRGARSRWWASTTR